MFTRVEIVIICASSGQRRNIRLDIPVEIPSGPKDPKGFPGFRVGPGVFSSPVRACFFAFCELPEAEKRVLCDLSLSHSAILGAVDTAHKLNNTNSSHFHRGHEKTDQQNRAVTETAKRR